MIEIVKSLRLWGINWLNLLLVLQYFLLSLSAGAPIHFWFIQLIVKSTKKHVKNAQLSFNVTMLKVQSVWARVWRRNVFQAMVANNKRHTREPEWREGWGWFETKWSHDLLPSDVISTQQLPPVTTSDWRLERWEGRGLKHMWKDRIGLFIGTAKSFRLVWRHKIKASPSVSTKQQRSTPQPPTTTTLMITSTDVTTYVCTMNQASDMQTQLIPVGQSVLFRHARSLFGRREK